MYTQSHIDVFRIKNLVELNKERRMAAAHLELAAKARTKIEVLLAKTNDSQDQ